MAWIIKKLKELGAIVGGGTPSTKHPEYYTSNGIGWITPKDLSGYRGRFISHGERDISSDGLAHSSARLMPKGTVLFSSRAPIGYVAIAGNDLCTNQGFKSIVPNESTDSEFLYYLMLHNASKIEAIAGGSTFKEVSGSVLGDFSVMVPDSLDEQRSIASVLSSLDSKIELNNRINDNLSTNQLRSPDNSFGSNVSRNSINRWFSKNVDWIFLNNGKTNSLNSFAFSFDGITTFISASPPSQTA